MQVTHGNSWTSIGTNKVYTAMQFFGGTTSMIPGQIIPARPFLPLHPETHELTTETEASVLDILEAWLSFAIGV